ncbi:Oxygen regulatory protein NreC [Chryseobacterium oranimense G311]|uniref:response regulator transcription factor n=1 Tax=Chryseobacterium oranimense TaxID=421058 RepID=UPI0005339D96|nr:response regulator transcription factor [Chryseobacterium oranimense]CEJ68926.1 Oxygen regulatory protein NreC [Chryseobacterium oranimense G311]
MEKKILIADDHSVVRLGTSVILQDALENVSIDFAINYPELKKKLRTEKFDLLILDIEMEGSIYKLMIKELKEIQEDLLIMIFSSSMENVAVEYIMEGAEGYVSKLSNDETLAKAVKYILENGHYYPPALVKQLTLQPDKNDPVKKLSKREFEVFRLLGEGNGNLEIANELKIQAGTMSTYKKRIYSKLGINNLIDLFKIYKNLD